MDSSATSPSSTKIVTEMVDELVASAENSVFEISGLSEALNRSSVEEDPARLGEIGGRDEGRFPEKTGGNNRVASGDGRETNSENKLTTGDEEEDEDFTEAYKFPSLDGKNNFMLTFWIPKDFVGRVIGRGGEVVTKLIKETHTRVYCDSGETTPPVVRSSSFSNNLPLSRFLMAYLV